MSLAVQQLVGRQPQHVAVDHGHACDVPVLRDALDRLVQRVESLLRAVDQALGEGARLAVGLLVAQVVLGLGEQVGATQIDLVEELQCELPSARTLLHKAPPGPKPNPDGVRPSSSAASIAASVATAARATSRPLS